jgi:hypothetical protein
MHIMNSISTTRAQSFDPPGEPFEDPFQKPTKKKF